jgi:anti-sigma factor ChrR (cupin superfamily)
MSDEKMNRAAEYALGTLPPQEREALARAAAADPALAAEIKYWDEALAPLLLDTPEVEPPPHLFDKIKAAIAERGRKPQPVAASLGVTVRAGEGRWRPMGPGLERKVLFHDQERARITFLVRAQPGAEFPAHDHDEDEESYVISGDLVFDDLVLGPGDYHVARRGDRHPVARSPGGCMLLVTAAV